MHKVVNNINQLIQCPRVAKLVLMAISVIVFINIIPNDFIMDDFDFVVNWDLIQKLQNFPRFFVGYLPPEGQPGIYSPLRTLMFALNYAIFQDNPAGWHIVSIIIHIFGVWAVYHLTRLLLKNDWISFLTGLIFAVHPVHVEPIACITGSIDTAGVVLGLWAFYWYLQAVRSGRERFFDEGGKLVLPKSDKIDKRKYYLSIFLAALAIFTHELMIALPLCMMMFELLFVSCDISWKRALKRAGSFIIIVLVYVVSKAVVLGGITRGGYLFDNAYLTFLVVIKAWAEYIGVLFVPVVLTHNKLIANGLMSFDSQDFDQAAFFAQSWHDPQTLLSLLLLVGLMGLAVYSYRSKPLITFCIAWFYLSLLPVSQIIPSAVYYAERYLYPGSWIYCLVLAWAVVSVFHWLGQKRKVWRIAVMCFMGAIVLSYGARTMLRNRDFKDWITFYEKAAALNPQSAYLKNDLAILYLSQERFDEAEQGFLDALEIQPDNAHFYFSLAEVYASVENFEDAKTALTKAIAIDQGFADAHFNLGISYYVTDEKDQAEKNIVRAIELWRQQGKILEASEALEAFMMFQMDQQGLLKDVEAMDILKANIDE